MPDYTQFDLVDILTGAAARMGWEAVSAETSDTHAVLSFRNPAALSAKFDSEDRSATGDGGWSTKLEREDGPGH